MVRMMLEQMNRIPRVQSPWLQRLVLLLLILMPFLLYFAMSNNNFVLGIVALAIMALSMLVTMLTK